MNLNEAAELLRSNHNPYTNSQAINFLAETMLSWLDPTPISEDWLRANGWLAQYAKNQWRCWGSDNLLWKQFDYWVLSNKSGRWRIKTLGELRALLRLMGET